MLKNKPRIVILIISALIITLIAACQPTPENETIVNKGNNELENKVLEQPAASPSTEATQSEDSIVWNETKAVNAEGEGEYTIAVSIDAKIPELPDKVPCF
jgi:competence protein ComGC